MNAAGEQGELQDLERPSSAAASALRALKARETGITAAVCCSS
jgi:hypothetical protein